MVTYIRRSLADYTGTMSVIGDGREQQVIGRNLSIVVARTRMHRRHLSAVAGLLTGHMWFVDGIVFGTAVFPTNGVA
jgi:hypothetical protein